MSVTYAIPDLHGRLDLLEIGLARITRHAGVGRGTIVTLGDYVDRGPNSRGVIERLMGFQSSTLNLVALKGNHEAMMWETCNNLAELSWWIQNGGDQTLQSYGQDNELKFEPRMVPRDHLRWIEELALMHVDQHRVFVHAAVDDKLALDHQVEQTLLWKRYPKGYTRGYGSRHVVHGHHASPNAPIATAGKTNLDGHAWRTGRLVIGVFDDDHPGGAVEILEVIAPATYAEPKKRGRPFI